MDKKEFLIKEICNVLGIQEGMFTSQLIRESLEGIKEHDYQSFFNALIGDEHEYLKPLDRVAKVAKHFKHSMSDELFKDTPTMANRS